MKKVISVALAVLAAFVMHAQDSDALKAALDAAKAITEAPVEQQKVKKPSNWTESMSANIKFGQTSLTNWAAGGDNTVTLQAYIDANANYKKNDLFWNNRLQLDYGFIYASSKPILQKSDDRIYLESKFGYKNANMKNFSLSVNYDFKSQFTDTYDYPTPGKKANGDAFGEGETPVRADWLAAKSLKSGLLAPAYTNLAVGIDVKPFKWLSFNIAPVTGGVVIVSNKALRKNYGMELKDEFKDTDKLSAEELDKYNAANKAGGAALGNYYKSARFEFGAQIKTDIAVNVNDNFKYTSQLVLFSNYLDHPENLRVNWDNRFDWKLTKYFSLTLTTNMIYDDKVMIFSEKDGQTKQRVQFKESLLFGFTWTIANKK